MKEGFTQDHFSRVQGQSKFETRRHFMCANKLLMRTVAEGCHMQKVADFICNISFNMFNMLLQSCVLGEKHMIFFDA